MANQVVSQLAPINQIPPHTHRSHVDFTVAYTSATTLTCAGAPFVIDDANCLVTGIHFLPTGGAWQPLLPQGAYSITAAANVITVAGAGDLFNATDAQYVVYVLEQDKGYDVVADALVGRLLGAWGMIDGADIYKTSHDFTAAYQSATTIDLTGGFPAITDETQFLVVVQVSAAGVVTYHYPAVGYSWDNANSRLTVTGATFSNTDSFGVAILGQAKAYDALTNTYQAWETNVAWDHLTYSTPVDQTNGTDGTYYYYLDCATYDVFSLQLVGNGGSGNVTFTVEGTAQDDGTVAASCTYHDVTYQLFGVYQMTATAGLDNTTFWTVSAPTAFKYLRIKVVALTGADDADWTIYARRLYS